MLAKALLTKLGGNKALGDELLKLGKERAREEASGKLKGADKLLKRTGKPVRELLKPVDKAPKLLGKELKGNKKVLKRKEYSKKHSVEKKQRYYLLKIN